jgi:hypothetical protein
MEDDLNQEKFILTSRYVGEDVSDVMSGKEITVAIALPKTGEFTIDDPDFFTLLINYGIGSLNNWIN